MENDRYQEICANCGLTFGSHRHINDQCPGYENSNVWSTSAGTTFESSNVYGEIPDGTPAKNL